MAEFEMPPENMFERWLRTRLGNVPQPAPIGQGAVTPSPVAPPPVLQQPGPAMPSFTMPVPPTESRIDPWIPVLAGLAGALRTPMITGPGPIVGNALGGFVEGHMGMRKLTGSESEPYRKAALANRARIEKDILAQKHAEDTAKEYDKLAAQYPEGSNLRRRYMERAMWVRSRNPGLTAHAFLDEDMGPQWKPGQQKIEEDKVGAAQDLAKATIGLREAQTGKATSEALTKRQRFFADAVARGVMTAEVANQTMAQEGHEEVTFQAPRPGETYTIRGETYFNKADGTPVRVDQKNAQFVATIEQYDKDRNERKRKSLAEIEAKMSIANATIEQKDKAIIEKIREFDAEEAGKRERLVMSLAAKAAEGSAGREHKTSERVASQDYGTSVREDKQAFAREERKGTEAARKSQADTTNAIRLQIANRGFDVRERIANRGFDVREGQADKDRAARSSDLLYRLNQADKHFAQTFGLKEKELQADILRDQERLRIQAAQLAALETHRDTTIGETRRWHDLQIERSTRQLGQMEKKIEDARIKQQEQFLIASQRLADARAAREGKSKVEVQFTPGGGYPYAVAIDGVEMTYVQLMDPKVPEEYVELYNAAEEARSRKLQEPTAFTRSMWDAAEPVLGFVNAIDKRIDEIYDALGPVPGRWNDLMTGKLGEEFPEFEGFRAEAELLSSWMMRMHAGRSNEHMYRNFKDLYANAAQSPENMKEALKVTRDYANRILEERAARIAQTSRPVGAPTPLTTPTPVMGPVRGLSGGAWYAPIDPTPTPGGG